MTGVELWEKRFWFRRCKISLKFHLQIEVNLDLILTKSEKQKNVFYLFSVSNMHSHTFSNCKSSTWHQIVSLAKKNLFNNFRRNCSSRKMIFYFFDEWAERKMYFAFREILFGRKKFQSERKYLEIFWNILNGQKRIEETFLLLKLDHIDKKIPPR